MKMATVGASPSPPATRFGAATSAEEFAERLRSAGEMAKSPNGETGGPARASDGQVEAYTKLGPAAPVNAKPEATFRQVDVNGDGGLSESEIRSNSAKVSEVLDSALSAEQLIEQLDRDKDGKVGQGESSTGVEARAGRSSEYQRVV